MRPALLTFYGFLISGWLVAQPTKPIVDPTRKIPVEALRADFRLMRSALEELHPSLYGYTPKDTLSAVFDRTYAAITRPMAEGEFMNLLYPAICQIRCGHTQLEHSVSYRQSPNRPARVHLPFDVFVRGKQAWLLANQPQDSTLTGMELISLNKIPIAAVIQTGLNSWNGDGYHQTWNEFFLNEYDFFEDVCWDVYGWKGPYELELKRADGTIHTVIVPAKPKPVEPLKPLKKSSSADERTLAKQRAEEHKRSYLNLRFLPDSVTALLMVNGLEYGDEAFYEQAFRQIEQRRTKNLVLDIRRNHGGDIRIINKLLSYLADSSYVILQGILAKSANPGNNRFAAHFDPDLNASYTATFGPSRKAGDWYSFDFKPEFGRVTGYQPLAKHHHYGGNVYVLIDGGTFSNGSNFAAALKVYCRKAVFIGRETGGTERGCGGGTNNKLTLPHSKLVLQFPWMRLVSASRNPTDGYGLQPDYPVVYSPLDIAQHRDKDLEKALTLLPGKPPVREK